MSGFQRSLKFQKQADGRYRVQLSNEFASVAAFFTASELEEAAMSLNALVTFVPVPVPAAVPPPPPPPPAPAQPDRWNPGIDANGRTWTDQEAGICLSARGGEVCFQDGAVFKMERGPNKAITGHVLDSTGKRVMKLIDRRGPE